MAEGLKRSRQENDMLHSPIVLEVLKRLGPDRRVLDIGAGVGRFTVPLAEAGCRVTALEPSSAMRGHLAEALREQHLVDAVTVIPDRWPYKMAKPVEIALAAYVVHFAEDPLQFIRAMNESATERCVMAVHVDSMIGPLEELWPLFRPDQEVPHMLVFSDLYPLLLDAGIVANVEVFEQSRPRFSDRATTTAMFARRLALHDDPPAVLRLEAWVNQEWDRITGHRTRSAIISWHPVSASWGGD